MQSIVLELQADALKHEHPVADLLRKALIISRKLKVTEIETWLAQELNGYGVNDDIPDYRSINGQVKFEHPNYGWRPMIFEDTELGEKFSQKKISQTIGELDDLRRNAARNGLIAQYTPAEAGMLMKNMPVPMSVALHIPSTELIRILDSVRTRILEWALALEEKGVLGEGMSFSEEEKRNANKATYQTINNIGYMSHSQLQQHSSSATQTLSIETHHTELSELIERIQVSVSKLELDDESTTELLSDIGSARAQLESPKPKSQIVLGALHSIKNILEGAAGNILATELLKELSRYL